MFIEMADETATQQMNFDNDCFELRREGGEFSGLIIVHDAGEVGVILCDEFADPHLCDTGTDEGGVGVKGVRAGGKMM